MRITAATIRAVSAAAACLVLSAGAHAQEISGFYLGVGAGIFNYQDDEDDNFGIRISDTAGLYRLIGGYQLNSNYAVEASWGSTDDITQQIFGRDADGNLASLNIGVEYELATLRLLAFAPVSGLSMFGGIGYYDATSTSRYRLDVPAGSQSATDNSSDSGFTVVGGIQYEFRRIALRAEYEWFDTSGGVDATSINVAALFRF